MHKGILGQKKATKPNKLFRNYVIASFGDSNITGLSAILKSKGCLRKCVKTVILVACVCGFLYQTYGFLDLYWQYSTVASKQPLSAIYRPAITICDANLIRRIYYCEERQHMCINETEVEERLGRNRTFCSVFPQYCMDPVLIYKKVPFVYRVQYEEEDFEFNFTKASGFLINESLISCKWHYTNASKENSIALKTIDCGKPKFARGMNEDKFPGACYTLSSHIKSGTYTGKRKPLKLATAEIILSFNASNMNNMKPDEGGLGERSTGQAYYVSFHDPGTVTNPFRDGVLIEESKMYRIQLSQMDYTRLASPYSTHCFDYWKEWLKNGRRGPLNREECQDQCKIDASLEALGCVPRVVNYPHEHLLCYHAQPFNLNLSLKIDDCAANCKEACYENTYKAEPEILGQIALDQFWEKYGVFFLVKIYIDFNLLNSVETVYKPNYASVELFSYIGGYLGMWLGWSLIAIFDFFEILISFILHLRKKRRILNVKALSVKY